MKIETRISVSDIGRLLDLVSKLTEESGCSTSEAVEQLARLVTPETSASFRRDRAEVAEFIARIRRIRVRRNELIGAPLFRDPAWDMLLELFTAHEHGHSVSVSSLCYASGVPPTTALRQIARLEEHGLVQRTGDPTDHRRNHLRLTDEAAARTRAVAELLLTQSQDGGADDDRVPAEASR